MAVAAVADATMGAVTARAPLGFVVGLAAIVTGGLAVAEALTWFASRDLTADGPDDGAELVVVLGYRSSPRGRTNVVQRWRTGIALRSVSDHGRLVFTGGPTRGVRSEASVMAEDAVRRGFPADRVVLEEESRTTWENVRNTVDLLRTADTIRFASNTFHARRARRYLIRQAPELAGRLRPARDFVWGERPVLTTFLLVYELVRTRLRPS
ncbi:YdcF family protein [Curtobacterium sp. MCBD17_013]|nr:YdcF family protein [Curtobacterium sp. MCBD17_013]